MPDSGTSRLEISLRLTRFSGGVISLAESASDTNGSLLVLIEIVHLRRSKGEVSEVRKRGKFIPPLDVAYDIDLTCMEG